jgi:hypothetical protein
LRIWKNNIGRCPVQFPRQSWHVGVHAACDKLLRASLHHFQHLQWIVLRQGLSLGVAVLDVISNLKKSKMHKIYKIQNTVNALKKSKNHQIKKESKTHIIKNT